jgi:surface antigen
MSLHPSLVTLAAVVTTGFVLAGQILLGSTAVFGAEGQHGSSSQWTTRVYPAPAPANAPVPSPPLGAAANTVDIAVPPHQLDEADEVAALERIQFALSEVGDGKTYVWRRWHGRLSGIVQPTASFKDDGGKVCRHLIVLMTTGQNTKKQEGIACRLPSGRWQLDG